MRLKKSARLRTIRRYVERHNAFKHNCQEIECSTRKGFERGCGKW